MPPILDLDDLVHSYSSGGPVVVVGSINIDHTSYVNRLPLPGETVLAGRWREGLGGKGANQAVAAAGLGASVMMVGCVGDDPSGEFARARLADRGVDVRHVWPSGTTTGAAQIIVDDAGQNSIVVAAGANAELYPDRLARSGDDLSAASVVLSQGELPRVTIDDVPARLVPRSGHSVRPRFVLNLAPALDVDHATLSAADPLVVNETEAIALLGGRSLSCSDADNPVASAIEAASTMTRTMAMTTVITLGDLGAVAADRTQAWHQPAVQGGTVRDTTGAGDAFTGTLAALLAEGSTLRDAVRASVCAGTLATAGEGAADSFPSRAELEHALAGVPAPVEAGRVQAAVRRSSP